MNKLRIGIVGGSLAGCSAAILLLREGHDVQVFERSRGRLTGRGGGIGTSGPVFKELIENDIIDADMPHLFINKMPFIIRTPDQKEFGRIPMVMPAELVAFHWSTLWDTLRKRVPDTHYHQDHEVTDARSNPKGGVRLHFQNRKQADFDLVLFADGYQSLGRQLIAPDTDLDYCGYMLWRGLLPEKEMTDGTPLEDVVPRIWYPDLDGNLVLYFIPGFDGQTTRGERIFNWAAYIPIAKTDLDQFMKDRNGAIRSGSIPPGQMRLEEENHLKKLMINNIPEYYGEVLAKTKDTYVQLIYTSELPTYYRGRMGLIGDAGMVIQPFTGSGIFKGYNNAKDLIQSLNSQNSLDDALQDWSDAQVSIGKRLLNYGNQLEKVFIYNDFDLSNASTEAISAWWKAAVTPPKEFSITREDELPD